LRDVTGIGFTGGADQEVVHKNTDAVISERILGVELKDEHHALTRKSWDIHLNIEELAHPFTWEFGPDQCLSGLWTHDPEGELICLRPGFNIHQDCETDLEFGCCRGQSNGLGWGRATIGQPGCVVVEGFDIAIIEGSGTIQSSVCGHHLPAYILLIIGDNEAALRDIEILIENDGRATPRARTTAGFFTVITGVGKTEFTGAWVVVIALQRTFTAAINIGAGTLVCCACQGDAWALVIAVVDCLAAAFNGRLLAAFIFTGDGDTDGTGYAVWHFLAATFDGWIGTDTFVATARFTCCGVGTVAVLGAQVVRAVGFHHQVVHHDAFAWQVGRKAFKAEDQWRISILTECFPRVDSKPAIR
jgi:hypothetical protein